MTLEQAQLITEQFKAKEETPQVVVEEQTTQVVDGAIEQPEVTPVVETQPAPVIQEPQQEVVKPEVQPSAEFAQMQEEIKKIQHSYSTLQGKYNKELGDSRSDNAQLRTELNTLKDQLLKQASIAETPRPVDIKDYIGQDKVEELGENYVEGISDISQYEIKKALDIQNAQHTKEIDAIKEVQMKERWDRYNSAVGSKVGNFVALVDPLSDGKLDQEFAQYLIDNHMYSDFDNADVNMNVNDVADICNMYNRNKTPVQEAPVAPVAPVQPKANPKLQAVAPPTTNNSIPQLQPSEKSYIFSVRDYIDKGNQFARGSMKLSQWLKFEKNYNKALADGKVKQ